MEQKARTIVGEVVSAKMEKTAVVAVTRTRRHPRYLKFRRITTRLKCHNEGNRAKKGDIVAIEQSRPLSREKRWKIVKIMEGGNKQEADKTDAPTI